MSKLSLKNIVKQYDDSYTAVKDFNLEIEDQEFIVLVGPSGCGKSTTLRMIAGLEQISSGELKINGKLMNKVEPKDRDIAMVFQNYALYPHMTVRQNISYGLKVRKIPKSQANAKVEEAAKILGLTDLLDKKPGELSGGQRQRVALGRVLVRDVDIFLMDEPLSNLDAKLRVVMRSEIMELHNKMKSTTIYVTHDQVEAMTMATRIIIMNKGVIQQIGTPKEVYSKPANLFVASFMGSPAMNLFNVTINQDKLIIDNVNRTVMLTLNSQQQAYFKKHNMTKVKMGIRPEHITLAKTADSDDNTITMSVLLSELYGSEVVVHSVEEDFKLIARLFSEEEFHIGQSIDLKLDIEKAHFYDLETEERIETHEAY
ncbi:sn-glycerol-3-phosphate ABC transporter ATP-binding protein UgpC [Aerococcaceae bacterium INB8]|uniref:sn-glycerol-3-phosphate ABC transporter ATP-binding protein UgpC n=1 Tax=Ruoffia halotolerans TaxID=2748684 RepID=A0A839A7D5_9LACT|nr:sn-glycerol-3-phosphate ABC transporter ATP-binding protein UgpC [Ruoffia halotolerans]MBA5729902.1 sn-glycerol-3-phosphate ABC transporter ATP-binding protein UgpC [Ruoffia halotolerans]